MKHFKSLTAFLAAAALISTSALSAVPVVADDNLPANDPGTGNETNTGAEKGKITILKKIDDDDNDDPVHYLAYQIFSAHVEDTKSDIGGTGKTETGIQWANPTIRDLVVQVLKKRYPDYDAVNKRAFDAAKIISDAYNSYDRLTRVEDSSLLGEIKNAIKQAGDEAPTPEKLTSGEQAELNAGYWLIVSDPDKKLPDQHSATLPIYAAVGGDAVEITEKSKTPTVDKKVKGDRIDKDGNPDTFQNKKGVDSEMDQWIDYQLSGSVSENIGNYDTYKYKFTDTLSAGLTADKDHDFSVYVLNVTENKDTHETTTDTTELKRLTGTETGEEASTGYSVSLAPYSGPDEASKDKTVLTVEFKDLLKVKAADGTKPNINGSSRIYVEYKAKLDKNKAEKIVYGAPGNENEVKLTYSNNPDSDSVGETKPKETRDYTFKLNLHKIHYVNETPLPGAYFTIQATGADELDVEVTPEGKKKVKGTDYVQADGSLGEGKYEFVTDEEGWIRVKGLDAGTYTIRETVAPEGYRVSDPFTVTITAGYDDTHHLTSLTNTIGSEKDPTKNAPENVIAGDTDGNKNDSKMLASKDGNAGADYESGEVLITVGDEKEFHLPLTGQAGIWVGIIAGGTILIISIAAMQKRKEQSEE